MNNSKIVCLAIALLLPFSGCKYADPDDSAGKMVRQYVILSSYTSWGKALDPNWGPYLFHKAERLRARKFDELLGEKHRVAEFLLGLEHDSTYSLYPASILDKVSKGFLAPNYLRGLVLLEGLALEDDQFFEMNGRFDLLYRIIRPNDRFVLPRSLKGRTHNLSNRFHTVDLRPYQGMFDTLWTAYQRHMDEGGFLHRNAISPLEEVGYTWDH